MPELNPNPYESPVGVEQGVRRHPLLRWRLIPTAFIGAMGAASTLFGLVAVGIMSYVVATRQNAVSVFLMMAACSLYLGVGVIWLFAASCFWRGKYRMAIVATVVGFVIPTVVFSIFG